jgi:hypothetical protein
MGADRHLGLDSLRCGLLRADKHFDLLASHVGLVIRQSQ